MEASDSSASFEIAIVGMSGRFPDAPDLECFWRNVRNGFESIRSFTEAELSDMGVDSDLRAEPGYVGAGAILTDIEAFDSGFFGLSPRESALVDPQQRLFLECAWEAIEDAGYAPDRFGGSVGVYGGTSMSSYLLFNLLGNPAFDDWKDSFQLMIANDKDFLSTRVAYLLDLKGPCVDVQTGCSTSLVAIHLACQALLSYQCDVALAGGVSVHMPQRTGYFCEPGGILSPDGHCRPFDHRAAGTIFGSGAGVVVLTRLEEARARGHRIYAVIKGSAINNDGSVKVGFTAPGLEGQANVVLGALALAGVHPESIGYIEAHGTGTALGDPIEIGALTKAFRAHTDASQFCAVGSVKHNVGHLDAAAGVAGVIKTALALHHRMLPPSPYFEAPSSRIDFASSPFFVNVEPLPWKRGETPRRAGVSSFGIGGTNAHVVMEEAPEAVRDPCTRPYQLLPLSAKTESALVRQSEDLAGFLRSHRDEWLPDIAFTLQDGRKRLDWRRTIVCRDLDEAAEILEAPDSDNAPVVHSQATACPVAFLFPGGGAQYAGMAADLYRTEPAYRNNIDRCAEILDAVPGSKLREILSSSMEATSSTAREICRTTLGLPALFAVEFALAQLLMSWGIAPTCMLGHSMGEYVAACLAGVFSLEAALAATVRRGELFERLEPGAMLSVEMDETQLEALAGDRLSIAAVNGPHQCVVSGPVEDIENIEKLLAASNNQSQRIHIDVAAHSEMVESVLEDFRRFLETMSLGVPKIPFISNLTGTWIRPEQAIDPLYWTRHLRETVRFADGAAELLKNRDLVLLEVGPSHTLRTLIRSQPEARGRVILGSLRHPQEATSDAAYLMNSLGRLWQQGASIDWQSMHAGCRRRRVSLPSYPFERRRCWVEPPPATGARSKLPADRKRTDLGSWTSIPCWRSVPQGDSSEPIADVRQWLVLTDESGVGSALASRLRSAQMNVLEVACGQPSQAPDFCRVRPGNQSDIREVLERFVECEQPLGIVHLWTLGAEEVRGSFAGLRSLAAIGKAVGATRPTTRTGLWFVTDRSHRIEKGDVVIPEKAAALGLCFVLPQEYECITTRFVDLVLEPDGVNTTAEKLWQELCEPGGPKLVAFRGPQRWVRGYEPFRLAESEHSPLRQGGVYLLTGGLGHVGLQLGEYLARSYSAKLVLTTRRSFPPRSDWPRILAAGDEETVVSQIQKLLRIEEEGAEVTVVQADAADLDQMLATTDAVRAQHGVIHGLIHLAGTTGRNAFLLIEDLDDEDWDRQLLSKAEGASVLAKITGGHELDFVCLFSSTASVLGGVGLGAYSAANLFLDVLATEQAAVGLPWISVGWDGWPADSVSLHNKPPTTSIDRYTMTRDEALEMFHRVLASAPRGCVTVSTGDLTERLALWIGRKTGREAPRRITPGASNTDSSEKLAPIEHPVAEMVARIWQETLGLEGVGLNDNFFELGGNSLIGLKVVSRLRAELDVELPTVALFEAPTVSALAELIGRSQAGGDDSRYQHSQTRGGLRRSRRRKEPAVS